jgi:putative redox protein
MVKIQVTYEGNLRCLATHDPSGTALTTDAPRDNQGKGEAFSPTDLVATALVTCAMTVMGIEARKLGVDLGGSTCDVEKEMVADPLRRIGRLPLRFRLPASVSPEHRARLEKIALTCPVNLSLGERVERPMTFEWTG